MNSFCQCVTCNRLGHCTETSVDKVIASYVCSEWREVEPEIYAARYRIITLFGKQGVQAVTRGDD